MRGHFELTLSDGKKIPLRFCTWSLKRFCQLQGIGPSEIGEALSGQTSLDAIVNLLRAAAEYPLYKEGITPDFTDMVVCDWIDEVGGILATDGQLVDYIKYIAESTTLNAQSNKKVEGKKKA